jgi:predicted ATPase
MITQFKLRNYKCLANISIPLTPIHVIIGQNDSGKTSLLEAILALSKSTETDLANAFSGDWKGRDLVYEGTERPEIEFVVTAESSEGENDFFFIYELKVEFPRKDRFCHQIEEACSEGGERFPIAERAAGWSTVGYRTHLPAGKDRDLYDLVAEKIGSGYLYRFDPKVMAVPAAIDPSRKFQMDPDGFGLATLLDDILGYDPEHFLALRREFCEFFPQFRSVRIETEAASSRQFHVTGKHTMGTGTGKAIFLETVHGTTIRAQQASDGAILFLGFLALIYSPQPPKLLLIEEPEKGVYPKRLEEVVSLIRRLQEAPSGRVIPQIIMTTHSPYLLSLFKPEEVTFLTRQNGTGPVIARPLRDVPHIQERLGNDEFYLGELWYNEDELFADA